jgi:hypothetical protein
MMFPIVLGIPISHILLRVMRPTYGTDY